MGTYLSLLTQVKSNIYAGRIDSAKDVLRKLLNSLNNDYMSCKIPTEKEKLKKAIMRLLPVLEELKAGRVGPNAITYLKLDLTRLPSSSRSGFGGANVQPSVPPRPNVPPRPDIPPRPSVPDIPMPYESTAPTASAPTAPVAPVAPTAPSSTTPAPTPVAGGKKGKRNINQMMPLTLDDYIGQEKAKRSLRISIGASKKTGRPLAHMLICSPYGLGKTTLTNIIANEMGMPFFNVNATNLKDVKSLSLFFTKIDRSCLIFIDEIHSLKKEVQTVLLSIMTDFEVNFIDDNGEEIHYELPPFTLIGATTQAGELLKPFLNRFTVLELEDYTDEEKRILVSSKIEKLGYTATEGAIEDISRRCRGIPRTIETFIKGVIDIALMRDEKVITEEITALYFEIHETDELGLTKTDRKILQILDEEEKPLALITMESKSGIQKEDIAFRYEPYLLKLGFMAKTERGRVITKKGKKYLHPEADNPDSSSDGGASDMPEIGSDMPDNVSELPEDDTFETPDDLPTPEAPESDNISTENEELKDNGESVSEDFFDDQPSDNSSADQPTDNPEDLFGNRDSFFSGIPDEDEENK
ncbi:MAG: AAA family ATPase [Candidatus Coproplasma sp.]